MAAVISLGLDIPAALPYLVQERLLPPSPPRDAYTWQCIPYNEDGVSGHDELLTTKTCVVWSRGGVVRKCFRFEIEEEPVTRAIITSFSGGKDEQRRRAKKNNKGFSEAGVATEEHSVPGSASEEKESIRPSRAIVVFLETQAHVYFLAGTSYVIHLPFEVEHAWVAPNGLIMQRKLQLERSALASLRIPHVPPNSFISPQIQPSFLKSSQQSTFSIESLGSPKQLPLPTTALLNSTWQTPTIRDDSNWPRLFSLTDPLAEMGLLVNAKSDGHSRRSLPKAAPLDSSEELIYVSQRDEFPELQSRLQERFVVAVSFNRENNMYTVWKVEYIEKDEHWRDKHAPGSGATSRRRSSFAPGSVTGATTPIASHYGFREGLGPTITKTRREDVSIGDKLDLAITLDPDFEANEVPRRKSRRVSSMLARQDLSATHERVTFSELASHQPTTTRRGESFGGAKTRHSLGLNSSINGHAHLPETHFGSSINSFLDAPVDDLLEELRAGGDFEGFTDMGLDDYNFEGLKREVVLSKIDSFSSESKSVHFTSKQTPAQVRHRSFALAAPLSSLEDPTKHQLIICMLDTEDNVLLVLTLNIKIHNKLEEQALGGTNHSNSRSSKDVLVITKGNLKRGAGVLDACKLTDGAVSRILLLTGNPHGHHMELTLQAPWSRLVRTPLPEIFRLNNVRNIVHDFNLQLQAHREEGLNRVLSNSPPIIRSLQNSHANGIVGLVDEEGCVHQVQIQMEPTDPLVRKIIEACRFALPGSRGGEDVLTGWWDCRKWLHLATGQKENLDWSALVIILFALILGNHTPPTTSLPERRRKSRVILRSSSGVKADSESWDSMISQETAFGSTRPAWMMNAGWAWIMDQEESDPSPTNGRSAVDTLSARAANVGTKSLQHHIKLTYDFISSDVGRLAAGVDGYLPVTSGMRASDRQAAISDIILALHLLREEQKLDITVVDSPEAGRPNLTPVLAQLCRWIGWSSWADSYDLEDVAMDGIEYDHSKILEFSPPFPPPSIYDWMTTCLVERRFKQFPDSAVLSNSRRGVGILGYYWSNLVSRTTSFERFFSTINPNSTSADIVEALHSCGISREVIDTLPEAVSIPLREAIVECQTQPPVHWNEALLRFVDREDVGMFLIPEKQRRIAHASLLAPTHEAGLDVQTICASINDAETVGAFDGFAEVDRQSITRLIWKDDQRFNEAARILNTSKPTVARLEPEPEWSESDLLEAQKDHVQMLAIRTLAIPTGRGLLYYSARIPLLTEKFPIGGFNLHCVMKPTNNTVNVDKLAFTEEKVCWAFFHAGVAAGLSISRDAKGIDTSWVLYNKPQELSNRHAGFLLALGLNGHLKSLAKWVAFKYLTPKHTMTSIGLLLGLAASHLGTMDSLITRLLSVHVTRMLPPGAAELNLSPLTQTTGILGIGLLYCNTQHRRMSEIMLSEIEYVDPEAEDEPLRNEGYRLAAGFSLGLINLGKGTDLKGLYDLHLTERLLALAIGQKKVSLVHVLDKATAAATVAVALIFMKSGNRALAKKIDVPDSLLQYSYVRPDIFLLRTLARNLIMWDDIEASMAWITNALPKHYRHRATLTDISHLSSDDLPFYDIVAGNCFSIALRHAGSGSTQVRDLLLHYLDQLIRICHLPAVTYDQKLTRNTTRNCQDLLALAVSTVMAGTGDLAVLRRLRSLHGREDSETPYGSHLAAHTAVGALFLGGGTYTFGTSDFAIAALIIAFYPIFPTSILDNKSHLQAFRHFWVLATEARCLVPRDVDTNRPVPIPMTITTRDGTQTEVSAPCLLPELHEVASVSTQTREYWPITLDFSQNPAHLSAFKQNQTIFVRRRPAYDAHDQIFHSTLTALDSTSTLSTTSTPHPLSWLFTLPAFATLTQAEKALVLPAEGQEGSFSVSGNEGSLVDTRLMLEKASVESGKRDRLLGLRVLFEWAERMRREGREAMWIRREVVGRLEARVWEVAMGNRQ